MSDKILLVEDSKEVHRMVERALGSIYQLLWAQSIDEAKSKLQESDFKLVLLDIGLPDGDGLELCQYIVEQSPDLPIFLLTGKDGLSEKVLGFSAGADDYITKPFDSLELKARVEARIKKNQILKGNSDKLAWNELQIDKSRQEVAVNLEGEWKSIELTALEFKILMYFAQQPGVVVERDKILDEIWGKDVHIYARSVDTHVSKLRRKMEAQSSVIESVHGVGYKFNPTSN